MMCSLFPIPLLVCPRNHPNSSSSTAPRSRSASCVVSCLVVECLVQRLTTEYTPVQRQALWLRTTSARKTLSLLILLVARRRVAIWWLSQALLKSKRTFRGPCTVGDLVSTVLCTLAYLKPYKLDSRQRPVYTQWLHWSYTYRCAKQREP